MHSYTSLLLPVLAGVQLSAALDIPSNIQNFYNSVKSAGSCANPLKSGFYATDDSPDTFSYCGDHLDDFKVVYLQGVGGAMADMDIDCDGLQNGPGDDGRCGSSGDTQDQTSFQDTVASYGQGVTDLNAFIHPYVVFGNVGTKAGYTNYDPTGNGVEPLSLMAVVCGDKMFYGIWGDENGDDGPKAVIGEASISMATLCFGDSVNGDNGYGPTDILYLAFTGKDAVPGASAKWNAGSVEEFTNSIQSLGDKLIQRIGGTSDGTPNATSAVNSAAATSGSAATSGGAATSNVAATSAAATTLVTSVISSPTDVTESSVQSSEPDTCLWEGHCAGASCKTENDCSGELVCVKEKCGN